MSLQQRDGRNHRTPRVVRSDRPSVVPAIAPAAQATAFIHLHTSPLADRESVRAFCEQVRPALDAFNQCPSLKQVDVYVSDGFEEAVRGLNGSTSLTVNGTTLEVEQRGIDVINRLIDQSRDRMDRLPGGHRLPRFRLIGLGALTPLLNALLRAGPEFVHRLAGPGCKFTYDCPKIVESLLRMHLWLHGDTTPLLRFDADVEVNDGAVRKLIAQYDAVSKAGNPYYLFSGGYCGTGGNGDFINSHAVRAHWLEDAHHARLFLRDIGEIGAPQVPGSERCSSAAAALIRTRGGRLVNGVWPQAISGGGLVKSGPCLRRLPPFMSASHMYVWVDDYFPRLLHEQIGDIPHAAVQRVTGAEVRQNRHPSGIGEGDISWAQKFYFERLLRGALLLATVADVRGRSGPLADAVKRALDCELRVLNAHDEAVLLPKFWQAASERYAEVVALWVNAEYGNDILRNWVRQHLDADYMGRVCTDTANDAVAFLRLVQDWRHVYLPLFENLVFGEAERLFGAAC